MKQTRPLVVALLLFSGFCASFVGAQTDPIDAYIKAEMEKRRIPGLALTVIQHGDVIKMQGYGLANVELDVPVTPDTVFELASVTKQFTATAIMRLVKEGKVGLDHPISHYLSNTPDAWQGMTATSVLDQWAIVKNRASGYTIRHGQLVHIRRHAQIELPSHYGICSTVQDLVKWEAALTGGKVVQPSSLDQLWTPVRLNNGTSRPYGFGWRVEALFGHRLITHEGITGTQYSRFPDAGLTVIVLTNLGNRIGTTAVDSWGLTIGVAGRYIPNLPW